ncbi:MAG: hypothetical protein FJ278_07060 [Planctomycetes bacterium]|nr:hypothetical protein [Planctomycetota bacterium]
MKPVKPRQFYVTDWALADERCKRRLEAMMKGFGVGLDKVQVLTEETLEAAIRANHWDQQNTRLGCLKPYGDPDVVFTAFRWPTPEQTKEIAGRHPILQEVKGYSSVFIRMLYGCGQYSHHDTRKVKLDQGITCWTQHDFHSAYGCFHKCGYCSYGRAIALALNVEEILEHVDGLMAKVQQKVYVQDNETDALILEPEYGLCRALVEHFARLKDRYIILFSKSDNVDFLLNLDHKGHTIMLWSLTSPLVSRRIDRGTATTEERLAAARECQQAGYPVRLKLKPIIPVANWRQEATDTLEKLFAAVQPDNLSMQMLVWSGNTVAEAKEMLDMSLLDPEAIKLINLLDKREADGLAIDRSNPFPDAFRAEVYSHYIDQIRRISPDCRVSLCRETKAMWDLLGPKLGMTANRFVCSCGPFCVPGIEAKRVGAASDEKDSVV